MCEVTAEEAEEEEEEKEEVKKYRYIERKKEIKPGTHTMVNQH